MVAQVTSRKRRTLLDKMTSTQNGNGYVTRKELLGVCAIMVSVCVALGGVVVAANNARVTRGEFDRAVTANRDLIITNREYMRDQFGRLDSRLSEVLKKTGN